MEQADRDKILQNIEKLIQYTDYEELMRLCIERRLLYDVMREQIEVNVNYLRSHAQLGIFVDCSRPFSLFSSLRL